MSRSANLQGIVAMVVAMIFFSLMDGAMKFLVQHYPSTQVAALRGLASMPLVCGYVLVRGDWAQLLRVRWPLHLIRGLLGMAMLPLFVFALSKMPLSAAYAITFVAPLMITMLSVPILKERVRPQHWWAIGAGFIGVLIALRPGGESFLSLGTLAVLAAAACYSGSSILGRLASRTDSSVSLVFWSSIFMSLGCSLVALPVWMPLRMEDAWLILALGLTGFGGQLAITQAFRHGQASAVAPFEYTALAWALAIDWLVWSTLPDHYSLVGAAIIIASGVYLIRHEKAQVVKPSP